MNASGLSLANNTPLCYSINSPPFKYNPPIASAYYSTIFTILGLPSNLLAFIVLVKAFRRTNSRSRSFFLIFLGGLVVTDFMGLLVTGSITISFHATKFNWRNLDPYCHFCNFMGMSMVFYGLCPLLLGAAMAVERFIGINRPFARSTKMPKGRTISMVLMVWFIAGCIALLPLTGIGSYHIQKPGSWCFFLISSKGNDLIFSLIFSLVGLMSITVSFLLNTVSVVTLIKVCCGQDRSQRSRDHEVEMMVQLILIMLIASICWCPLLIFIAQTVLSGAELQIKYLLLWLRFATWNQILDPWIYILFRRAVLKRIYPRFDWSRSSIMTLYPPLGNTLRRLTRSSLGSTLGSDETGETGKTNVIPPSSLKHPPPSP
ncbi:thromboxane A2 receptor isoform X1 [Seriola lalandi dorsalis]|uniref:Thromboxane A2 receptor n=1 Tax=Seriola lalandi dorsalis TaxID=1841481 RepID=A0A3B4YS92_SERLL|nr:thromboxane A2 receptor isoform X1 [Seriola lalandi dorsalis]XP_023282251.1 thromboxane A2 receptor isoform X1 [Seriola lalandi dorsalis]